METVIRETLLDSNLHSNLDGFLTMKQVYIHIQPRQNLHSNLDGFLTTVDALSSRSDYKNLHSNLDGFLTWQECVPK